MRMRTISKAAAYIRETDLGTDFTESALRRLITSGTLPSVRSGSKYLVALEVLEDFVANGTTAQDTPAQSGTIRPVEFRR